MGPKLGLYSISYAGMWYAGPALSIKEFIDRAKRFGFEGVELDCRKPHALPYILTKKDRDEIVDYADKQGIEIGALAANNDFSSPVIEHRDAQIQLVIEMIKLCKELSVPILRIFAAWRGSSFLNGRGTYEVARPSFDTAFPHTPEMDRWKYCLDSFRIITQYAEEYGVTLALQNHPPIVRNSEDCLAFAEEINSPNFKLCFDISGERAWQSDEWVLQQAQAIGDRWVHSHFSGDFKRDSDGKSIRVHLGRSPDPKAGLAWNFEAWVQGMYETGYQGYVNYEACTPIYLRTGELVPMSVVDERVQLAKEHMLDLFTKFENQQSYQTELETQA